MRYCRTGQLKWSLDFLKLARMEIVYWFTFIPWQYWVSHANSIPVNSRKDLNENGFTKIIQEKSPFPDAAIFAAIFCAIINGSSEIEGAICVCAEATISSIFGNRFISKHFAIRSSYSTSCNYPISKPTLFNRSEWVF